MLRALVMLLIVGLGTGCGNQMNFQRKAADSTEVASLGSERLFLADISSGQELVSSVLGTGVGRCVVDDEEVGNCVEICFFDELIGIFGTVQMPLDELIEEVESGVISQEEPSYLGACEGVIGPFEPIDPGEPKKEPNKEPKKEPNKEPKKEPKKKEPKKKDPNGPTACQKEIEEAIQEFNKRMGKMFDDFSKEVKEVEEKIRTSGDPELSRELTIQLNRRKMEFHNMIQREEHGFHGMIDHEVRKCEGVEGGEIRRERRGPNPGGGFPRPPLPPRPPFPRPF